MELVAIDVFAYDDEDNLTVMDVHSGMPFVYDLPNGHTQEEVHRAFEHFESAVGEPGRLLSDRGHEFGLIRDYPFSRTAAYHPEGNSVIERFHKELANLCRIHKCSPMEAVKYYRTPEMRRVFYARGPAEEKAISYGSSSEVIRSFSVGDLVSRFIPRRSRTKASDVWSEPMRVLQKLGDRDYSVWNGSRKMVVHVNDIKGVFLPSGVGWEVRPTLLDSFLEEWQVDRADLAPLGSSLPEVLRAQWEGKKILLPVSLREGSTVLSKFKRDRPALLIWVVPHMPTEEWFKELESLPALWIAVPKKENSLVDEHGDPVGLLCVDLWMVLVG